MRSDNFYFSFVTLKFQMQVLLSFYILVSDDSKKLRAVLSLTLPLILCLQGHNFLHASEMQSSLEFSRAE